MNERKKKKMKNKEKQCFIYPLDGGVAEAIRHVLKGDKVIVKEKKILQVDLFNFEEDEARAFHEWANSTAESEVTFSNFEFPV